MQIACQGIDRGAAFGSASAALLVALHLPLPGQPSAMYYSCIPAEGATLCVPIPINRLQSSCRSLPAKFTQPTSPIAPHTTSLRVSGIAVIRIVACRCLLPTVGRVCDARRCSGVRSCLGWERSLSSLQEQQPFPHSHCLSLFSPQCSPERQDLPGPAADPHD